jgi:hypothetical protein
MGVGERGVWIAIRDRLFDHFAFRAGSDRYLPGV